MYKRDMQQCDWSASEPWLRLSTCGVRRAFTWSEPFLRRMRLGFWLAYWNPGPGAAISSDAGRFRLDRETLLLVPPGTWLRREQSRPFEHWWCHFRTTGTAAVATAQLLPVDGDLGRLLRHSWTTSWAKDSAHPASILSCHAVLALALGRLPWTVPTTPESPDPEIAELQAWLRAKGCPALTNAVLAQRLHLHPKSLVRRFTRAVGQPPQAWLRDRRLDLAAERLVAGMAVEQAAEQSGFVDRFHLGRLFRRRFGVGPGSYRRMFVRS